MKPFSWPKLDDTFLRLFFIFAVSWMLLLAITLVITLRIAQEIENTNMEETIVGASDMLAEMPGIQAGLASGALDETTLAFLDTFVAHNDDIEVITVAGTDSVRLYHVVHERIGEVFVGDDQWEALSGETYFSDAVGTLGLQHRRFTPVYGDDGAILGFVMVSATMVRYQSQMAAISDTYLGLALALVVLALVLALILSFCLQEMLQGHPLEDVLGTYLDQNLVLESLEEGVVYIGSNGRIRLVNAAACHMLSRTKEQLVGQPIDAVILSEQQQSLLLTSGKQISTSAPNLLVNVRNNVEKNGPKVALLILTDKTEAEQLAQQLAGSRHMISALRANTHEFMNRLQVISGLIQMNAQDEALRYIGNIAHAHAKGVSPVVQRIQNHTVAALILGKCNNMRELNVTFTLLPSSILPPHSAYLSTGELVILVGNLLENAIEAINAMAQDAPRNLDLHIKEDDQGLLIQVSDTGVGIPAELCDWIYTQGFSTKASEGRGVGLGLIRNVVTRHNGTIEFESEVQEGTTFTVIISEER